MDKQRRRDRDNYGNMAKQHMNLTFTESFTLEYEDKVLLQITQEGKLMFYLPDFNPQINFQHELAAMNYILRPLGLRVIISNGFYLTQCVSESFSAPYKVKITRSEITGAGSINDSALRNRVPLLKELHENDLLLNSNLVEVDDSINGTDGFLTPADILIQVMAAKGYPDPSFLCDTISRNGIQGFQYTISIPEAGLTLGPYPNSHSPLKYVAKNFAAEEALLALPLLKI